MKKRIAIVALASMAWLLSQISGVHAAGPNTTDAEGSVQGNVVEGWNFIHASNCLSQRSGGIDILTVYSVEGGGLNITDPLAIATMTPLCVSGKGFYAFISGGFLFAISVYPSIS
jgi:hypothetical protein